MNRLQVRPILSKKSWNSYIELVSPQSFFQSWEWGEITKLNGSKIDRCGIYYKDKLIGVFQLTQVLARRGKYIMLRHGPIFEKWERAYLSFLVKYLKTEYTDRFSFIRISPLIDRKYSTLLVKSGFKMAPVHENTDAQVCYIVDLEKNIETILSGMRKNTRRAINKAISDNSLTISSNFDPSSVKVFMKLYKNTAHARGFFEWKGIKNEINEFLKTKSVDVIIAFKNKVPVAGAIVNYWGGQGIYHYGGANSIGLKSQAQYLVIWEAIKRCKQKGYARFNLWGGIEDIEDNRHPWYGLTLFKRGFGSRQIVYLPTYDYVLSFGYILTYVYEFVIEYLRGYKKMGLWRSPLYIRRLFGV